MGKTLRELIEREFSDAMLDLECTSLKVALKTPKGGSIKTDYSARRAKAMLAARTPKEEHSDE